MLSLCHFWGTYIGGDSDSQSHRFFTFDLATGRKLEFFGDILRPETRPDVIAAVEAVCRSSGVGSPENGRIQDLEEWNAWSGGLGFCYSTSTLGGPASGVVDIFLSKEILTPWLAKGATLK